MNQSNMNARPTKICKRIFKTVPIRGKSIPTKYKDGRWMQYRDESNSNCQKQPKGENALNATNFNSQS